MAAGLLATSMQESVLDQESGNWTLGTDYQLQEGWGPLCLCTVASPALAMVLGTQQVLNNHLLMDCLIQALSLSYFVISGKCFAFLPIFISIEIRLY